MTLTPIPQSGQATDSDGQACTGNVKKTTTQLGKPVDVKGGRRGKQADPGDSAPVAASLPRVNVLKPLTGPEGIRRPSFPAPLGLSQRQTSALLKRL